jgi:CubicO group peptidase (beta-lactamase class C family)
LCELMKRFVKVILFLIGGLTLLALGYVLVFFPPIMAGTKAKVMCSCVFVTGRTPESVMAKEMNVFPGLGMGPLQIDLTDSTVTARVLWKTSKAIYRKGAGCALLAQGDEEKVRTIKFRVPPPPVNPDTIAWPLGNMLNSNHLDGIDYEKLRRSLEDAFADRDKKNPVNTHGVVVVYNGHLVAEKYAEGFDHKSRMMGWSMTKSMVNALVGIAVKSGKLRVEDPAPIQEWQDDERKQITLNDLLQASSGLAWHEGYFTPTSDFHKMFTLSDDKAAFAIGSKAEYPAGTFFQYSSGTTNLLCGMLRRTLGDSAYHRFPYDELFYKAGMYTAIIEADASGTFVGSSYGYASARDWARFGLLYLNDGVFEDQRILPEGWVKYSTTPAPAAPMQEYGAHIWLNAGKKDDPTHSKFRGLPNDAYLFDGFEGNSVVVIPSRKTVIVRLGVTHNKNFSLAGLVQAVLASLPAE